MRDVAVDTKLLSLDGRQSSVAQCGHGPQYLHMDFCHAAQLRLTPGERGAEMITYGEIMSLVCQSRRWNFHAISSYATLLAPVSSNSGSNASSSATCPPRCISQHEPAFARELETTLVGMMGKSDNPSVDRLINREM